MRQGTVVVGGVVLAILIYALTVVTTHAQVEREIIVIDAEGPVTTVMLSFMARSIEIADERNAEALIVRLNTPGGQINLTQEIVQVVYNSDVPVVIYVSPPGGMAASAGTFITMAGHVAAMAPNTTIGAASPVSGDGADIDETLRKKVENILVAEIESLADRRGEDAVDWAKRAITEAEAANAKQALELGVIDIIATDLDDLIAQLDGFTVTVANHEKTLQTADATVEVIETTFFERILNVIADPSIALLLVSFGTLAIFFEFINPGGYMSGVVGVILLLLGMYGVGQLPVNYAGVALIVLALILFIAEVITPTFGALTAGGVAAFIFGGLILFNTSEINYQFPLPSLIGIPVSLALIFGVGMRYVFKTMRQPIVPTQQFMVGAQGTVRVALSPDGTVFVKGERWRATSVDGQEIEVGAKVEVLDREGFSLLVQRAEKSPRVL